MASFQFDMFATITVLAPTPTPIFSWPFNLHYVNLFVKEWVLKQIILIVSNVFPFYFVTCMTIKKMKIFYMIFLFLLLYVDEGAVLKNFNLLE